MKTKRQIGRLLMAIGTALILSALILLLSNRSEATHAAITAAERYSLLRQEISRRQVGLSSPSTALPLAQDQQSIDEQTDRTHSSDEPDFITIDGQDYIGCLVIPSLDLRLPVLREWSEEGLRTTPCRHWGSVDGNDLVIAGHDHDPHFGRLDLLAPGDLVRFLAVDGRSLDYVVQRIELLRPTEVDRMRADNPGLSLYSCNYDGRRRVTVRCAQISGTGAREGVAGHGTASHSATSSIGYPAP